MAQTCYVHDYNNVMTSNTTAVPCSDGPGIVTCCNPGDICLGNNTCHAPETRNGSGTAYVYGGYYGYDYYTAGCTDSTFASPLCSLTCGKASLIFCTIKMLTRFPVYAAGLFKYCDNDVWTCGCVNLLSSCTCENSASAGSGVNFTMPAPSALSSIASLDGDVAVPYTTSSSSFSSASSASLTSASASASASPFPTAVAKGSNNAVKIGAGVGVSLGVLLLVAMAIAIFFWRRSKRLISAQAEAPRAYQGNTPEWRT